MSSAQEIVTINLTTNGETPSGETAEIIIDKDKMSMVNGQSLFRRAPNNAGMFIIRDPSGNFLQRHDKDGVGVSLSSYLFGKAYMRRTDPTETDDYTAGAFKDSGRFSAIKLLKTPDSTKPIKELYKAEFLKEEKERLAKEAAKKAKKQKNVEPASEDLHAQDLQHDVASMKALRDNNRNAEVGTQIVCPQCGDMFVKQHWKQVFCSSYRRPGEGGKQCKDTFNGRLAALQKKAKPIAKPTVKPSKKASEASYDENTNGLYIKTESGREMRIDADTLLSLDVERLRILVGN